MRTLFWLGLGAAAMYLMDPDQGRRRRALARDQITKARRVIRERASGTTARKIQTPEGARHLGR
jgi:hypothetical protein